MQASGAVQIENDIRYAGYVALDRERIERQRKHASRTIPEGFDYGGVRHLRAEAREQLARIRPRTLGQAGRVSGITPADLALVLVYLEGRGAAARSLPALSIASASRSLATTSSGRCFFRRLVIESLLARRPVDLHIAWIRISKAGHR
jgi:hypothetical protein